MRYVLKVMLSRRSGTAFGSRGLLISMLARVEQQMAGFAVDVTTYSPGGHNERHSAGLWQLLAVVQGEGWASGADGKREPLCAGDAVLWEPHEEHESGTDNGMTVVIVQSPVVPVGGV